jgi:hypothetical protein
MSLKITMRFLFALLLLTLSSGVFAFDGVMHKLICSTAYELSEPKTKQFIDQVMLADKRVAKGMSFAEGCNWPDEVRSTTHKSTNRFHFMNVPRDKTFDHRRDCATLDCVTQAIQRYGLVLAKPDASSRDRKQALLFLGHFVADIHQPLHVGNGEDWGGNKIKVFYQLDDTVKRNNLHFVWDAIIPIKAGLEANNAQAELVENILLKQQADWKNCDVIAWAKESFLLARKNAYAFPDGQAVVNDSVLNQAYYDLGKSIIYQRVMMAAVRLAFILDKLAQGDLNADSFYQYQHAED